MIAQTKSYMPVSDDNDWIGASHHNFSTVSILQGPPQKTGRFDSVTQTKDREENESVFDDHQQSKAVRLRVPDSLKQLVAGLILFSTIIGGLSFVVWFFWALVMGSGSLDIYDLADVIHGKR